MHGDQYAWLGTAFYLGYLFFVFPATLLIQRYPLAKITSIFIVAWGLILCLHAVAKNYAGLIALRVLLGVFESIVTPAMVLITSQWYKKEEQMFITSIWLSCNGLGTILGGAIAYGLAIHGSSYTIIPWKVLFIITGLITIVIGIVFFFHIPDDPSKAWFLNDAEKHEVVMRIRRNEQGFGNRHFKMSQFKEAMTDTVSWIFVFLSFSAQVPNGAMTNFGSILLADDFGYSSDKALLMNMPAGAVFFFVCVFLAYFNRFFPRLLIATTGLLISLVGACLLAFTHTKATKLAGYYIYNFIPITMVCSLSCFSSNTAGHTKKITTNSMYLIAYCIGNLVGPQTFIASQAPGYSGGKIAIVVCLISTSSLTLAVYFVYRYRNRKRNSQSDSDALSRVATIQHHEFADLTDKENPYFRYSL